jgi:hypothetical protein
MPDEEKELSEGSEELSVVLTLAPSRPWQPEHFSKVFTNNDLGELKIQFPSPPPTTENEWKCIG